MTHTAVSNSLVQEARAKAKPYEPRDAKLNGLLLGAVDLNTIRELLGHSDYSMAVRYTHLAPEHRREVVEVLDKRRPHLKIFGENLVLSPLKR